MSQLTLLQANLKALQATVKISTGKTLSADERNAIANYRGFGGIKSVLIPLELDWQSLDNISVEDANMEKPIKDFYSFIQDNFDNHVEIWNSIKASVSTAFFTPSEFVDQQIAHIYAQNPNNIQSILDPCAGSGVYVDAFLRYYPNSRIVAVEQDFLTAHVLKAKFEGFPNVTVIHDGFENVNFQEQKFDLVASNIPFGEFGVLPKHNRNYPAHVTNRIHNFFFYHSLSLLNEGGALSLLTSTGVFNSRANAAVRRELAEIGEIQGIVALPNNLFSEAGTQVSSHLVNIVRTSNPDRNHNVKFLDSVQREGVFINRYIDENLDAAFLAPPSIQTNPYGTDEFAYRMDFDAIIERYRSPEYNFVPLSILSVGSEPDSRHQLEPLGNITLPFLLERLQEERLSDADLRRLQQAVFDSLTVEERNNFKMLAVITGDYMGERLPLFSVSRYKTVADNRLSKSYLITPHVHGIQQVQDSVPLTAREFQQAFQQVVSSLEQLSVHHALHIDYHIKDKDVDAQNFIKYFLERFNQPYLSTQYFTEFSNFAFHREPSVGMLVFNKLGVVSQIVNIRERQRGLVYQLEELKVKGADQEMLHDYLNLYDSFNLLISAEKEGADNAALYRERLNKTYDAFVETHGYINEIRGLRNYDKFYFPVLASLEKDREQTEAVQIDLFNFESPKVTWAKSDIFFQEKENSVPLDLNLALAKSFNENGEIDIAYITQLSNIPEEDVLKGLKARIIYSPLSRQYELRSTFFAGNIRQKIKDIQQLGDDENLELVSQLQDALPPTIPFEAIRMQFGTRWIPQFVYESFLKEYFDQEFLINFNQNTDTFLITAKFPLSKKYSGMDYQTQAGRSITPEQVVSNAFYDQYPIVTYSVEIDGKRVTYTDEEATLFYKRAVSDLKREFVNYLHTLSSETKNALTELYNERFNSSVVANYDTDILDFSEFDLEALKIKEIYEHQKRAVWKCISNEGGIVDHEVGLGKSFSLIATAHFGKKLGVFNKPIILGISANVPEIANTYRKLVPNANILFASEKDYEPKNRAVFFNKIRSNNYDCVIMSHDNFMRIPQSLEVEKGIIEQELKDIEDNLFNVDTQKFSKQQLRGLEKRKVTLGQRLELMGEKISKRREEGVLDFTDLGIDHIIVDESHRFKNLMFQTRHSRVSGLGDQAGSQKANNLLTALRTIQEKNKSGQYGATFFSGTVISNSITELYLVQKYLTPKDLKERCIYNFDAWCSTFAEKTVEFETNIVNKIIPKERFRNFINVPELSLMYNQMSDVMTGSLAKIDRPEKEINLLINDQTALQRKFYVKLATFLNTKDSAPLKLDKEVKLDQEGTAVSLVAMSLAFKASLDMRLLSSRYPDEPSNKINYLVRDVMKTYEEFTADRGSQIIFTDLGIPSKKLTFEQMDDNYRNGVFTCIYDDIKYKLIKNGIPEEQIAFIQDYKSQQRKDLLSKKMNNGDIRILIGGTENAGTGLNVQHRLTKIHHLTLPWKPSEVEQREGRGYRTGNWLAKEMNGNNIDINFCVTRNTLDNFRVDLIKHKKGFIDQIKGASIDQAFSSRHLDEGSMDEDAGMNLAELQAQLTGDNTLLKLSKCDAKIKELEQEKIFILTQNHEHEDRIAHAERRIREFTAIKDLYTRDLKKYEDNVQFDDKDRRINKPQYVDLVDEPTPEQLFNYFVKLTDKASTMFQDEEKIVAKMYGFELFVTNHAWDGVEFKVRNSDAEKGGVSYSLNNGKINLESSTACSTYFIRCFDLIENKVKNAEQNIASERSKIEVSRMNINQTFDKSDQLDILLAEREQLQNTIKMNQERGMVHFDTRSLDIGGEKVQFPVISTLHELHYALLHERLGREMKDSGVFLTPDIADVLNVLSEQENPNITILNQQYSGQYEFIKFRISDYDNLYAQYDTLEKGIHFSLAEEFYAKKDSNVSNPMLTYDDKTYYCYGTQAEDFGRILSIPPLYDNNRIALVIPLASMAESMNTLVNDEKLEVNVVRVDRDNDNRQSRKINF